MWRRDEVAVILGANGAGKTTTMRAISGMIPRRGVIEFDGQNLVRSSPDAIVRLGIAQVPQGRGTFTDLTVDDNLRAGAYVRRDNEVGNDLALWYEIFPRLAERKAQKAGTLSGGEQQMLAIAPGADESSEAAAVRRAEPRPCTADHQGVVPDHQAAQRAAAA